LLARDLALDGKAVMRILGKGPSPQIGQATRHLLERVLDSPELNTAQSLEAILLEWARRS
jgi:tRNA nucleotidyltransferase (CCA-adding enzyme)